jgi:hypothetical protein
VRAHGHEFSTDRLGHIGCRDGVVFEPAKASKPRRSRRTA